MWICVYLAKSDGTHEHAAMDLESHFTCCLPSHCHPQDELSAAHLPGLTHQLSLPWSGPEAQRGLGSDTYQTASCCAGPGATEVQLKLCKCPFVSRNTKLNSYWKHQNIPVKREIIGKKMLFFLLFEYASAKLLQSCLILCDPMHCSPPGFSVHRDSLGLNTGVGCHFLLQGIFPIQGLNSCLLHWQGGSLPLYQSLSL